MKQIVTMDASVLSKIPSELIRNGLRKVFSEKLQTENVKIGVESGSKNGDNFIGIVYRVTGEVIQSADERTDAANNLKLILKVAPQSLSRRERFFSRPCFLREIFIYNEVLTHFRELQKSIGINIDEKGFREYSECYHTIDDDMSESLLIEDLKQTNFVMIDHRTEETSFEHACLVMSTLGKFHALSFASKDKSPGKLDAFAAKMSEILFRREDDYIGKVLDGQRKRIVDSLHDTNDSALIAKINKIFVEPVENAAYGCVEGQAAEPYAVICHGDFWNNNILFKYDENHVPVDVRFLDWQMSRYASPATDIMYFFSCCTLKEFRQKHLAELLKVYHRSLSAMLTRLGSDPEKLFPFEALQQQLRTFGKFGVSVAALMLPMLSSAANDCANLEELAEQMQSGEATDVFENTNESTQQRLRDFIVDLDQFGYL